MRIIPTVDSTTFRLSPQVEAALINQLPPPAGTVGFASDPDGTPVLLLEESSSYLDSDPDGTPVLVIGA